MTAAQLLAWITVALLLQVAAGLGVTVWRRRGLQVLPPVVPAAATTPNSPAAWPGWRAFRVERRQAEDPAQTQWSFYLAPVDGQPLPPFKPGQFLTFSLDVPLGGQGTRTATRCYSLSDRPDPTHYRVTIKRALPSDDTPDAPAGLCSNHFHDRVHEGDVLRLKAPSGSFFIDPDADVPVVLIGGGIGITPMMSMLRWCLAEQPARLVHLYYGVRNRRDHAFKETLEALAAAHPNLRLNVVYSRPGEGDAPGRDFQHRGHIDVELLRRTLPHGRHRFYVCGPPTMMTSLVPALAAWGVARADLNFEAFGPATVSLPGDTPPRAETEAFEIRFLRSGRTLSWDGSDASLLDFAEHHGVAVESGCRSGGCGACETRLLEGQVLYTQAPDHDVAPGHCLLCIGRPASPLVLEA